MTPSNSDIDSKLKLAIAEILQTVPRQEMNSAFRSLSESYRSHKPAKVTGISSFPLFLSYIGSRMPATLSVMQRVLSEYVELGGEIPKSLVDVGAGPATASFAALSVFGDLQIELIEKELGFQNIAQDLAKRAEAKPLIDGKWQLTDIATMKSFTPSDLFVASYSLGEMALDTASRIAGELFAAARLGVIVVEPGTPAGFSRVRELREVFLKSGGIIAAPCPHQKPCPIMGSDFCHFSNRLQREEFHRLAKGASLPFEDEKFSYLIVTKKPLAPYEGRLVKKPIKSSGHVTLDVCSDGKIVRSIAARSNKSLYKTARKSEWGDRINLS